MTKNSSPHVLHVVSGDLWAGAESMLFTLTKALHNDANIQVSVVILNPGMLEQKIHNSGIAVFIIDESKFSSIQIFQQLNRLIKKIKPDVIHTHRTKENIIGSIAARVNKIPSLRTAHGASEHIPSWYQAPKLAISFLDRFCGHHLQKTIVAVSQDLADKLKKSFPPDRIAVIENGIDIEAFAKVTKNNLHAPSKSSSLQITIAGRLSSVKRIDIFIKTAQLLKQRLSDLNLCFCIYGEGPLRTDLEMLSQQLQTTDIVHFEGHCSDIKTALEKTDILLMTSDHEGLPMILLEAMATLTPIIAHAIGGITTLLKNGDCGTLVKENSPESYSMAISDLIQHPEQRAEIAQNAFKHLTEQYSAKQNAENYLKIYQNLTMHY